MKFNVVEIFNSIDGEGSNAGKLATFIRLAGCNLRCTYCDTKYSYFDAKYKEMQLQDIIERVQDYDCDCITLTGGEPLLHKNAPLLVEALYEKGYKVSIETNGSVELPEEHLPAQYIIDYKSPSSGENTKMIPSNFRVLHSNDIIKCVVANKMDLDAAYELYKRISPTNAKIYLSPVFGEIEPKQIVEYMQKHNWNAARLQLQLHKIIWSPDTMGV